MTAEKTADDTVQACPECDSPSLTYRTNGPGQSNRLAPNDAYWKCNDCNARFEEPTERPPHGSGGTTAAAILSRFGLEPDDGGA